MPNIGPLECVICVVPLLLAALFLFAFLKIISGIRGRRELGDRPPATTTDGQNEAPTPPEPMG